ncbi:MAG: DUF3261 domain-containing protein [Nevskiales bacterium]
MVLGGCALLPSGQELPPVPPLLSPASLGGTHAVTQVLHVAHGDSLFTLQCAVQADPGAVILIALGPLGQRAFTLHYDGDKLESQVSPFAPSSLPPERVLSDVQLAMWPLSSWQEKLKGTEWSVVEPGPGVRKLLFRQDLVSRVDYEGVDPWRAHIHLQNYVLGYSIDIEPQNP